jgi:hypothetical protein
MATISVKLYSDSKGTVLAAGDLVETPDGSGMIFALVTGTVPGVEGDEVAVVKLASGERPFVPRSLTRVEESLPAAPAPAVIRLPPV